MEKRRLEVEREWCRTEFQDANLSMATDSKWMADLAGHEFDEKWLSKINEELIPIGSLELDDFNRDMYAPVVTARDEFFCNVLGWDDEASPMHAAYQELLDKSLYLTPLATVIERFRRIDAMDKNVAQVVARFPKALYLDEGRSITALMMYIGNASEDTLRLPAVKKPELARRKKPAVKRKRTPKPRLKIDIEKYHSPEDIDRLMKIFANHGIDGARVLARKNRGLTNPVDLIESRLQSLADIGLNVASIIESYDQGLVLTPEHVRGHLPAVELYLDALRSDLSPARFVSDQPGILARSASKLLAVGGMLEGSTDLTGLPAHQVEPFARFSIDTSFTAMIDKSQQGELMYAQDLNKICRTYKTDEIRRTYNLESLCNTDVRQALATHAVSTYLAEKPLTESELTTYPDLVNL